MTPFRFAYLVTYEAMFQVFAAALSTAVLPWEAAARIRSWRD